MVFFNIDNWKKIIDSIGIANEDLTSDGIENEPHVTILYGFDIDKVSKSDIKKELDKLEINPIEIEIDKTSIFKNDEYDVVKFDVKNSELSRLNKYFKEHFPYETDFPKYHPHMTIAYVKSGMGKKYNNIEIKDTILNADKLVYSESNEDKNKLKIKIETDA